jgi:hypothetical protein
MLIYWIIENNYAMKRSLKTLSTSKKVKIILKEWNLDFKSFNSI